MNYSTIMMIQNHKLFFEGNIQCYDQYPWVAVIGGRYPSDKAAFAVEKIVNFIFNCGYGIINGLAKGVDDMALKEAQKRGVPTIGVIAGGLSLQHYPKETQKTRSLCSLVLSEYPDNEKRTPSQFLERNKVIIDLADVVIAFEGGKGTAMARRYAIFSNKPLIGDAISLDSLLTGVHRIPYGVESFIKTHARKGYDLRLKEKML